MTGRRFHAAAYLVVGKLVLEAQKGRNRLCVEREGDVRSLGLEDSQASGRCGRIGGGEYPFHEVGSAAMRVAPYRQAAFEPLSMCSVHGPTLPFG